MAAAGGLDPDLAAVDARRVVGLPVRPLDVEPLDVDRSAGPGEFQIDPAAVRGNHDAMLGSVWSGRVHDAYRVGDVVICHGHEVPDADAERYVVGHDHPAIEIEGRRRPCFLRGPYGDAEVVVLPAFTRLAAGAVVNGMSARDFRTDLVTDADALRPMVYDADAGETLQFPPLGEFRRML